jgi:hypothetical protein
MMSPERTHLNGEEDERIGEIPTRELVERTYKLARTRTGLDGEQYAQFGILIRELERVGGALVDNTAQLRRLGGALPVASPAPKAATIPPPMRARLESLAEIRPDDGPRETEMREKITAVLARDAAELAVAAADDKRLKRVAVYSAIGAAVVGIFGGIAAAVAWALMHVR